jgi:hypothetical protein
VGNTRRRREVANTKCYSENLKEQGGFGDVGLDVRILKQILSKQGAKVWISKMDRCYG